MNLNLYCIKTDLDNILINNIVKSLKIDIEKGLIFLNDDEFKFIEKILAYNKIEYSLVYKINKLLKNTLDSLILMFYEYNSKGYDSIKFFECEKVLSYISTLGLEYYNFDDYENYLNYLDLSNFYSYLKKYIKEEFGDV